MQDDSSKSIGNLEIQIARRPKLLLDNGMNRFPEKVKAWIDEHPGENSSRVATAIGVDISQFAKWLKTNGKPSVVQLLAIARHMGVSLDYLADDTMDAEPPLATGHVLSDDERFVLRVFRAMQIDAEEAVHRMTTGETGGKSREPGGIAKVVATQDQDSLARKIKEEWQRSGFEPEGDNKIPHGDASPPRRNS